jgi:N-acetylglucosaminyldiphosphoundecaprenol N-acetyl-beta-D-mannosaminyltransferase
MSTVEKGQSVREGTSEAAALSPEGVQRLAAVEDILVDGQAPGAAIATTPERSVVFGCAIDRLDMDAAIERCDQYVRNGGFAQHMAVNSAKLVTMQRDTTMRSITARCDLVTADGQAVVWAARLLGDPLPTRVAGIDLMERLMGLAEKQGYGVYILGARSEVLEQAVANLRRRYPELRIVGYRDGYFSSDEDAAVAETIRAAKPDMLFVAMSSPRKEYFLGEHGPNLGVRFAMGVGGAIDVVAGMTRRAPVWMQKAGLEWFYRLAQEPRRLITRYAVTNTRFIGLLAAEWVRSRRRAAT